ncbi:MAG: glycoside hydrolase family 2 protein [Pirellulales bacterium]|nr:glycoside hydrolase family 2 protein [Pirellulales bacterium]
MRIKLSLSICFFALTVWPWLGMTNHAQGAGRIVEDLSKDWRFFRADEAGAESRDYLGDSKWEKVQLPHSWNVKDTFDDKPGYYRGIGWYRRTFDVPKAWAGWRIVLRFEAACQVATVWVNGQLLGEHKGAWTPFEFDITELVAPGSKDNLVAVRVDNRRRRDVPPHGMDFNIMGGLHREVRLIAKDPVHITSVFARTPKVSEAEGTVQWTVDLRNQSSRPKQVDVAATLTGPGLEEPLTVVSPAKTIAPGEAVAIEQTMPTVARPKLWSPDEPNLYEMTFRLRADGREVDVQRCPLGFRWYHFDPAKGFFLNGKHTKLKGVNRHDDYPGMGWCLPASRQIADMKLIKEMGSNFVRTAHYPQHPIVLETCDRLGLLVWEEVPFDGETGAGPKRLPFYNSPDFARTLKENLRETILRDRNHPCIILWSLGNENLDGSLDGNKVPAQREWGAVVKLTKELKQIAHDLDPTRPTAAAINKIPKGEKSGLIEVLDVVAYNLYYGWYSGKFEDFDNTLDEFHKNHPDKPLIISEYGVGVERGRHTTTPKRQDFSEEWGCRFHEHYWRAIDERPFVAGSLVWNVFDFAAEHRVKKQTIPHMNQKGLFTFDRTPKDVYYYYKSQWTDEPMVYIVSHTWTKRKPGVTPIRVYSNADKVELFLGGKSLGVKKRGAAFLWDVPLAEGDNALRAKASKAGKTVVDELEIQGK